MLLSLCWPACILPLICALCHLTQPAYQYYSWIIFSSWWDDVCSRAVSWTTNASYCCNWCLSSSTWRYFENYEGRNQVLGLFIRFEHNRNANTRFIASVFQLMSMTKNSWEKSLKVQLALNSSINGKRRSEMISILGLTLSLNFYNVFAVGTLQVTSHWRLWKLC